MEILDTLKMRLRELDPSKRDPNLFRASPPFGGDSSWLLTRYTAAEF